MQDIVPFISVLHILPYHPLSDFFKEGAVAVEIDFSSSLSFWSCGFGFTSPPKRLAFEVTDGQAQWPFLAAFSSMISL